MAFPPWMLWAALVAVLASLLGMKALALSDAKNAHEKAMRSIAEASTVAIERAREIESSLRQEIDKIQQSAAKEALDARNREDALVESVRAGHRRLSIRAVCPSPATDAVNSAPASSSGAAETRAQLDPQTGVDLISIARDGDEAIRERNACVAAYEAARAKLGDDE